MKNFPPPLKEREHLCDNKDIVRWMILKDEFEQILIQNYHVSQISQIVSQSLKFRKILLKKSSILNINP